MIFGLGKSRCVVGIGLDGFPHSLAEKLMREGLMPNLRKLAEGGTFKRMNSVYPTVSNVAWSAFQTGKGPGEFGVYGFVELRPNLEIYIPNRGDLKCGTIWDRLDAAGKKFASLSVPMTFPAPKLSGFIVSGFLAPSTRPDERSVSRPEVLKKLRATNYEIDTNPAVAIASIDRFKEDLLRVGRARQRTALALLKEGEWDFFFLHVMDIDRLNHFMWAAQHEPGSADSDFFLDFYRETDGFLGQVMNLLGDDCGLMVCSDHGFCDLKWEVQLNRWLKSRGYLDFENAPEKNFKAVRPGSRAVALVPGRVYILTESRWERGCVAASEYEPLRKELMDGLRGITHPESGEVVCRQVMRREEVFAGPHADLGPDIVIDPCDGYDLKAKLGPGPVFEKGPRSGMHTYGDAMLAVSEDLSDLAAADSITDLGRLTAEYVL